MKEQYNYKGGIYSTSDELNFLIKVGVKMALELRVLSKCFPRTGIQRCTTASWGKTKSNNGLGTTKRGENERRGKKVTRRGGWVKRKEERK